MPHRILVVDDEESITSLLQDHLSSQGFQVFMAHDGESGIRGFSDHKPHLVLIDFLLPRKNGFAVAEAIRGAPGGGHLPLIIMSGVFKNPKTAVEARDKYQVVDFLSKPLDLDHITGVIKKALVGVEPGPDVPPPSTSNPIQAPSVIRAGQGATPRQGGSSASTTHEGMGTAPRGLSYGKPREPSLVPSEPLIRDGIYISRPFPELNEEGTVEEHPVALLLSTIRYDEMTGMLDMTDQATHRRIYITQGNPTFMQSNAEGENVAALLLRRGRITEPDFDRCLRHMKDRGRTLQQALLELRLVSEQGLATAYKLLAGQLLPLALGMPSGTYRWRETDAFIGRVPEGKFEPVSVLFDGIKRHVHPPQILKFFKGREDIPLVRTTEFDKMMPFFRRAFSAANVAGDVNGSNTYRSITKRMPNEAASVVPQLFALVTSGMTVLPRVTAANQFEVAVNLAAAEIAEIGQPRNDSDFELELDDGGDISPDEARVRAKIEDYYDEIMSLDFFQIFGAGPESSEDKIRTAYYELTKKWHTDVFAGMNLGSMSRKLDEIFARITEAYETITNKQKREEYMVYLERKRKGLPTDVNEILRGEQLYDQALAMIRRRDWAQAGQVLQEALQLNPDPLYSATLGWVVFNQDQKSQAHITEAVQLLKRAVKEQERLPVAYQYLGQICYMRGQLPEAKRWWNRCLEWEPNNIDAARGIRMVNTRADKDRGSKNGLLSKFLSKK